jgi:CheY-like chemotaxis protein
MDEITAKPSHPTRILVVDDEQTVLDAVRMSLEFYGKEVTTCTSGAEAIKAFKAGKFDAVVTDYAMSGMNGDELAAKIKEMCPACPVLMITSHEEVLNRKQSQLLSRVLSKPFLPQALNEALGAILKQI